MPPTLRRRATSLLAGCGFEDPTTTTVEERFVFADVDALLAWDWSHGHRRMLESFSEAELR